MSELLSFDELTAQLKDVKTLVAAQLQLRAEQGKPDANIEVLDRRLKSLLANNFFNEKGVDAPEDNSGIGQVISKAGKVVKEEVKAESSEATVEIGKVISPAKTDVVVKTDEVKAAAKVTADDDFLNELVGKPVEKLASTQYSKAALVEIIKSINEKKQLSIEVVDADTKQTLAEKIFAALNPAPVVPATPGQE